jgi:cytochrome c biogenesis protein CcmG/thiol:disulfide interchange protein DsbE
MAICSQCRGKLAQTKAVCPHCGYDFVVPEAKPTFLSRLITLFWLCVLVAAPVAIFYFWWPNFYRDITTKPYQSFLNQSPPELAPSGQWLNSQEPLTLQALRGKVVWLEFSFYRCGGCRAMTPQLAAWHQSFAEKGLVIIDVYNGQADRQYYSDPRAILQEQLRSESIPFPVLYDEHGASCDRYGVRGYPSGYLIDRNGKVIWEDCPHGNQSRVERKIREALRED